MPYTAHETIQLITKDGSYVTRALGAFLDVSDDELAKLDDNDVSTMLDNACTSESVQNDGWMLID